MTTALPHASCVVSSHERLGSFCVAIASFAGAAASACGETSTDIRTTSNTSDGGAGAAVNADAIATAAKCL